MTAPPLDDLAAALTATGDLVAAVDADQWPQPTCCPPWTVRDLVTHLMLGDRLFAGVLRDQASATPDALDPSGRDVLGADPAATYRATGDDLLAAFERPGALEGILRVPAGALPGLAAARLRAVETLVHGWDLAQAIGATPRFDQHLVERQLAFTRTQLAALPAERSPFGTPQPVPDDAPVLDRLVALLGRRPATAT